MTDEILWAIGAPDGRSPDLVDTYKTPNLLGDVVWTVPPAGQTAPPRRWPLFHPSEADPDAGYRPHPYTVVFPLDHEPAGAHLLRLHYLAIAPRLAYLELQVNGVSGLAYLRPAPSRSGEIRLQAGLHTTIYAEGVAEVVVPAALLRRGENRLVLTARDGGSVLAVENPAAIERLDRMADAAGFVYQWLTFARLAKPPRSVLAATEVAPSVVYVTGADGALVERCSLYLELARGIGPSVLALEIDDTGRRERTAFAVPAAAFGHLRLPFDLPDGPSPAVAYTLAGTLGGEAARREGTLTRRRKWTVYVAPHAHTDIGYTHRQWEVAERLCRNIDKALDLIAADDADPAAQPSFAYHLDSSWTLETYLATRGDHRRQQLAAAIAAGRLGVASNYVIPLTQFTTLEDLIRNGAFTDDVLRPLGRAADFAAIVDVASLTGALPTILAGSGVRYLLHANNQDRGPFRLYGGLHRRSPFYWAGPDGARVLVWLAKMYCELRKVCGSPPLADAAARGLDLWLAEYETPDYAPDTVLLYGQEADNTDLDPQPAGFVREWNATHAYPRLVPCAVSDYFRDVEARCGERLAALRGDGGAYWEDGVGSGIAPAIAVRRAQASLPAAERLEALAAVHDRDAAYPTRDYDDAWRQVLLFDEHTWGAFLSARDPASLLARDQWATKAQMAASADEWARRLLHAAATRHSLRWNNAGREVVVYNPHSWAVADVARVEIGRHERVYDAATGAPVLARRVQATATQAVVDLWIDRLDGLSYWRLALRAEPEVEAAPAAVAPGGDGTVTLENEHYRLVCDARRGCLTSWFDRALGRELVAADDRWGFGQLLYAAGGEGTRLVSNRADLPAGDPVVSSDFALRDCSVEQTALGAILRLRGDAPHGALTVEWLLHDRCKRLDARYVYEKEETRAKEAAYVAFPLALPGAAVSSDSQLGWVEWDKDELPGGCKEWLPLQSGVLVAGDGATVLLASPDVPLFCVGDVVRGRWPRERDLTGGRVFSYVLNNYWDTNYQAAQGGPLAFGYRLTSDRRIAPARAFREGWAARRPLYAQRLSYQAFRDVAPPYDRPEGSTLARVAPDGAILSTLKGARHGAGLVARLQEIAGKGQVATLAFPGRPIARAWATDLLEHDGAELPVEPDGSLRVAVPAWGLATVRLVLDGSE